MKQKVYLTIQYRTFCKYIALDVLRYRQFGINLVQIVRDTAKYSISQ